MKLRKSYGFLKVLSLCLVILLFTVGCTKEAQKIDSNTIAVVNGVEISRDIFDKNMVLFTLDYVNEFGKDILNEEIETGKTLLDTIKEQVMEKLVMEELLVQLAKENNLTYDEQEIADGYKDYLEFVESNAEFKALTVENNINEAFIKEELIKDQLIKAYQEHFLKGLSIDYDKAKSFYDENPEDYVKDEVKAKHILVSEVSLAEELLARIKAGESFEELAKQYSEDPGSKDKGGDLGYFPRGVMIEEFQEMAFSLEIGEISEPVGTMFGFHIIKVEDKISEKEDFEGIKDQIVQQLEVYEFQKHLEDKLEKSEVIKNTEK